MNVHSNLTAAASDVLRALSVIDARLAVIRDAQRGQPGAQRFGDIRSTGRTVCWCDEHECDVQDCHEADRFCAGQTIPLQDPTGEAAMQGDRARDDLRRLEKLAESLAKNADQFVRVLGYWQDGAVVNDKAGIGECMDCKRYADGRKLRLSTYKTTGEPVCPSCRARRDRRAS